jgi:hypothetical protein
MVLIDLDNIIPYYQPAPTKPPFKPLWLYAPILAGLYQSANSTTPLFAHLLPPCPPQPPSMAVHSRAPEIVNHHPPPDLGVEKPATLMH